MSAPSHVTRRPALLGGAPAFAEPLTVTRALAPDRALLDAGLERVLASRWFTNDGPLVRELEARLRERLGVGLCAAFASGTAALEAALRCLDLSGEVITTPFTFPATVHAIRWTGATPVFADVDPETYTLDPASAGERLSERTCALLPVHVFGNPCDVDGLGALAERRGLALVYDASHAFGVAHRGRPIGTWGDLSTLSFHATKIFHTAEGGAVVGADARHRQRLALLRNFGIAGEEEVRGLGINGKLSELHAALGLSLLDAAAEESRARAALDARYRERLADIAGIALQRFAAQTVRNHYNFSVEIDTGGFGLSRDELHAALRAENVVARKYFHPLCSENECYRALPSARPEALPHATRLASRILCLPLYAELGTEGVDRVCDALLAIREHAGAVRRALA